MDYMDYMDYTYGLWIHTYGLIQRASLRKGQGTLIWAVAASKSCCRELANLTQPLRQVLNFRKGILISFLQLDVEKLTLPLTVHQPLHVCSQVQS